MTTKSYKPKVKAGRLIKVKNKLRKKFSNAAFTYHALWVEDADGLNERCWLLTEKDIKKMDYRSSKNKEDWTNKGFWTDIWD